MSASFLPRQADNHLSVNWLEFFRATGLSVAVEQVQQTFEAKGFQLRPNGRFCCSKRRDCKEDRLQHYKPKLKHQPPSRKR